MRRLGYAIAVLVFVLDQLAKYWVTAVLDLRDRGVVPLVRGFDLTWVENTGVSMGLFRADGDLGRWLLVGVTLAIAAGVAVWIAREASRPDTIALGLVLGGALGNIVDRVRYGYVVDFFHAYWHDHHFYVFNVADAAITVGVILLLVRAALVPQPAKPV
ncbi:signal peptidase II [Polymorphobacter megasporae]|uniref:signal peptidase II n=1 Tax=Glacieibacterium megasporae TaxID=2835787 RepID=UPI001C1E8A1A|nr:signal peptidase II [Polymorphobacter megasporae]UAJ10336.1 signal peptidase II [Polymorphobacter megasporae]